MKNTICPFLGKECLEEKCELFMNLTLKERCAIKHIAESTDNVDNDFQKVIEDCHD